MNTIGSCWYCARELLLSEYGRGDSCLSCGRDTRVCMGCFYYDAALHNSCQENQAEVVVNKEKSNFCDYFKPSRTRVPARDSSEKLKLVAEGLFKKKGGSC
jgi:hypothetical protein